MASSDSPSLQTVRDLLAALPDAKMTGSAVSSASSPRPMCPTNGTALDSRTCSAEPHRTLFKEVLDVLIQRLGTTILAFGRDTAGDATALSERHSPRRPPG